MNELLPQAFFIGNLGWSWSDLFAMAAAPFTLGLSAAWPIIKRAGSIVAVTLIVAAIAMLPTLAWVTIGNMGFGSTFGPSLSDSLSGGMGGNLTMGSIALNFFYVLTFFFPVTTFAIACVNVFSFRFYLAGVVMLVWMALKGMYQVSTANQLNSDGSDRVEQLDQGWIDV